MILNISKMNTIGTYAYFQLEALYFYQIYSDFLQFLYYFPMLTPLQYWYPIYLFPCVSTAQAFEALFSERESECTTTLNWRNIS